LDTSLLREHIGENDWSRYAAYIRLLKMYVNIHVIQVRQKKITEMLNFRFEKSTTLLRISVITSSSVLFTLSDNGIYVSLKACCPRN